MAGFKSVVFLMGTLLLSKCEAHNETHNTKLVADGDDLLISVPQNGTVKIVSGNVTYDFMELIAEVSSLEEEVSSLEEEVNRFETEIEDVYNHFDQKVGKDCVEDTNVLLNGEVHYPAAMYPGSVRKFTCNPAYVMLGQSEHSCMRSGAWSSTVMPSCIAAPTMAPTFTPTDSPTLSPTTSPLGSVGNPAVSCKAIAAAYKSKNLAIPPSGKYWLQPVQKYGTAFKREVYCDMKTKAKDGTTGFTLCGKYSKDRSGSRYLTNGFGRSLAGAADMKDLTSFSQAGKKWSSIDCRDLINSNSKWLLHVGTNNAKEVSAVTTNQYYVGMVRFTNILAGVKANSKQLWNTALKNTNKDSCKPRDTGGVQTYLPKWGNQITKDGSNSLSSGHCLDGSGDGAHMFCTEGRQGIRFSNAGNGCGASADDTIYWAWDNDDHGCGSVAIGTGCQNTVATYKFNYLFIH